MIESIKIKNVATYDENGILLTDFKKLSIMKEINGLTRLITINVNFEHIMNRVR